MKSQELTDEQMKGPCPFCGAKAKGKFVDTVMDTELQYSPVRQRIGVAVDCTILNWRCNTKARTDDKAARQSLECRVNVLEKALEQLAHPLM